MEFDDLPTVLQDAYRERAVRLMRRDKPHPTLIEGAEVESAARMLYAVGVRIHPQKRKPRRPPG